MDRFLECALGVLKESGFRYVSFFGELDENGRNRSFEELNMCMTIAMALGITVTDVLLPAVAYGEYKTEALQEEYAPMIAEHILENKQDKQRRWVRKLPPETLAKLFLCLTNIVEAPLLYENDTDQNTRLNSEIVKAEALVMIMKWITPMYGNEKDTEHRCSQFEKALTLMGGNQESCKSYIIKWQRFAESWEHMANFILNLPIINGDREYNKKRTDALYYFDNTSKILCQRIRGYKFVNYKNKEEYIAYRLSNPTDSSNIIKYRNNVKKIIETKSTNNNNFVEIKWKIV